MRKSQFLQLFLLTSFILFSIPLVSPPQPAEEGRSPHASPPSFSPTPVAAKEEEEIDTFNVHPQQRYEVTSDSFTVACTKGLLDLYDTGDDTFDWATLYRGLKSLDDKIEIQFGTTASGSSQNVADRFYFYLHDADNTTINIGLSLTRVAYDQFSTTELTFIDKEGVERTKTLSSTYQYSHYTQSQTAGVNILWYTLVIDYDLMRSELSFKLSNEDNGTMWEYDWQDIYDTDYPEIMNSESLYLRVHAGLRTNYRTTHYYVNYIKAPFKDYEWRNAGGGYAVDDPQVLVSEWDVLHIEDDITSDIIGYDLVVPYLDSISGTMTVEWKAAGSIVNGDHILMNVAVYTVNISDGGLDEAIRVSMETGRDATGYYNSWYIMEDNVAAWQSGKQRTGVDNPETEFSIQLSEDRSKITAKLRGYLDRADTGNPVFEDGTGEVVLDDMAAEYSSEFLVRVSYSIVLMGDTEATAMMSDFGLFKKDIFQDIANAIGGILEFLLSMLAMVFVVLFTWLAVVFSRVGDLLKVAIQALEPLLGLVEDAVLGLWAALEPVISDILDWIFGALALIVDTVIGWGADLLFFVYDWFWETLLGFADAPDLIAIFTGSTMTNVLQAVIDFVLNFPALIEDVFSWIFLGSYYALLAYWFWALFLGFAKEKFDAAAGTAEFFGRLWKGPDITIWGFGPFHFPAGYLIFIPFTGFIILAELGVFFWIW